MTINKTISLLLLALSFVFQTSDMHASFFYHSNEDFTEMYFTDVKGSGGRDLLILECGKFSPIGNPATKDLNYDMVVGKRSKIAKTFVEQKFLLADNDTLSVRFFDDGVAWKKKGASFVRLDQPVHTWLQEWTDCYEQFFPKDREQAVGQRFGYPLLAEYPDGFWGLLTESGLTADEAGTSMYALGDNRFELCADGPEDGGWQTFIGGSLADVVESTLVTDNSAPCRLNDTSWIEPGVASWVYWAYNHGSNDYGIIKQYVDMAAELKLPYVLIDAEWDEMKDGKTVEDAVAYAVSRGVKPMIWYNSSIGWVNGAPGPKFRLNKPEDLEREFAWCEKIGVKGVKIDFFSGDTNQNWRFMEQLLEAGARHNLLVNFHGAPLPRGWQRTYPNLITTEAVYGEEWYNNLPVLTDKAAAHNATLPFTRNVVGSMDYTPCAFTDSQHPHITTDAHELALTALFESGIQHLADRPESFLSQPQAVKDFLSSLPAAWDDTILLGGYPGEYVMMARRKDNGWWISAVNGTDSSIDIKDIDYSRLRLDGKSVKARIFEDSDNGKGWKTSDSASLPASFTLLPRGGLVMTVSSSVK